MSTLILLRHGQSQWNLLDLFTGWVDVPLSIKGIEEALEAGRQIKDVPVDSIFTSTLIRAHMTLFLAMSQHSAGKVPVIQHPESSKLDAWGKIYSEETKSQTIPVYEAWELNERMYGELQGLNKKATAEKFGAHQVKLWRRSYDVAPPGGESLEMTAARSIPYFTDTILPHLKAGENILVSAHGNSLRSIVMYLDGLTKEQVVSLEMATGVPVIYDYEGGAFRKR